MNVNAFLLGRQSLVLMLNHTTRGVCFFRKELWEDLLSLVSLVLESFRN